jgi:Xaa-Pro aminopeptidase
LTDISTSSGLIIITLQNAYFFTDFRYIEYAKKNLGGCYQVELNPKEAKEYYCELLKKENVRDILFEENNISLRSKKNFDDTFSGYNLVESDGLIEKLRQTKDESEIENIAKAQSITDKAFSNILNVISDNINNITETDIAAELEYFMKKNGADDKAFDTICVSGKKSSYPHGEPENIKLSKGFLTMDFGARFNGYCSDMTRTICIGKADGKMLEVYNTVNSAQLAALAAAKAGIESGAGDLSARSIIDAAGYEKNFGHGLGHSLGLEIHETPRLAKDDKTVLWENVVITVEPGIYLEDMYGVRIEDMIVLKEGGNINLTKSDKNLIEL